MILVPLNRRILIEPISLEEEKEKKENLNILVPENVKVMEPRFSTWKVLNPRDTAVVKENDIIIVETHMVENITIKEKTFHWIQENYIIGKLKEE